MRILSTLTTLSIFLLLAFSPLVAQNSPIAAGKMMLAGDLSFANYGGDLYENNAKDKLTTISLNPSFGYFVIKGLQVGATVIFENTSQGKDKENFIGVGPYVAYLFGNGTEAGKGHTYPYAAVGFLYYTGSSETETFMGEESEIYKEDVSGTGFKFSLGFVHMLTNSVGFDTGVSYNIDSMKSEPKGEKGQTLDGTTLNIRFGIVAFF